MEGILSSNNFLERNLNSKAKIKIFESTVIAAVTYGAQTWAHTKKN